MIQRAISTAIEKSLPQMEQGQRWVRLAVEMLQRVREVAGETFIALQVPE
jgi:hypothetical protein